MKKTLFLAPASSSLAIMERERMYIEFEAERERETIGIFNLGSIYFGKWMLV